MDRRTTLFDGKTAHDSHAGKVAAKSFTQGTWKRCAKSFSNLTSADGLQDKQVLFGERFLVISQNDKGQSFGQCERDGYVGWLRSKDLASDNGMTHRVISLGTHIYPEPDIKSPPLGWLSMGSEVRQRSKTIHTNSAQFTPVHLSDSIEAFVPRRHLKPLSYLAKDPVKVAKNFRHVPYLWAGDGCYGIDCSGLVQRALLSCGIPCPRDSDQQQSDLGQAVPANQPPQRGDLVFWRGHVGMMASATQLIHANAFHMAVAMEPFERAKARIAEKEFGDITAIKRL